MTYKPKSKFIKNEIKTKSFSNEEDRQYIEDLLLLEKSITGEIGGWAANVKLFHLKNQYQSDYRKLLKELDPKQLKEEIKQKKKDREEDKRLEEKERKELEKDKKKWLKLGGKK